MQRSVFGTRPNMESLGFIALERGIKHDPRCLELIRVVESACLDLGIDFQIKGLTTGPGRVDLGLPCAGYILVPSMMDTSGCTQPLFASLSEIGRPVALWDNVNNFHVPEAVGESFPIKIFTMPARLAGAEVGRFLYERGHRHIAFFSAFHGYGWSQQRLEGLRIFLESQGLKDGLAEFLIEWQAKQWNALTIKKGMQRSGVLQSLLKNIKQEVDEETFQKLADTIWKTNTRENWGIFLVPLMQQILNHPKISAVVAATDDFAQALVAFARKNGRRVPEDISVIGFDDSEVAERVGLSSYNFRLDRSAESMMSFLSYPGKPVPLENSGSITVRDTVGPGPAA